MGRRQSSFGPPPAQLSSRPSSLAAPSFTVIAHWTLDTALDYVRSWSGSLAYREATGQDPAELVRDELAPLFGDASEVRTVRIPLFVRAARL